MRTLPRPLFALTIGFLSGCAATAPIASKAQHPAPEPDCSFRAATTCWTMTARFPRRHAEAADSEPGQILNPGPPVLASESDSAVRLNELLPKNTLSLPAAQRVEDTTVAVR
jgi:hypothetical protein